MKTWNKLTAQQKRAFGDRFITNESNLNAWDKNFEDLSEFKKRQVKKFLNDEMIHTLNYTIS